MEGTGTEAGGATASTCVSRSQIASRKAETAAAGVGPKVETDISTHVAVKPSVSLVTR
jgi:hypothetical protein